MTDNNTGMEHIAPDREELVRLLRIITRNGSLDDSRTLHEVIADTLIAAGWAHQPSPASEGRAMTGRCSVPMWMGGCPAGTCGKPAYGGLIPGPTFRDAWTGEVRRFDGKFNGYVPSLACPDHGGPAETGPRVYIDGQAENGRPMWCAVYEDFINLQESPAEFHEHPWVAIARLEANHPRKPNHD